MQFNRLSRKQAVYGNNDDDADDDADDSAGSPHSMRSLLAKAHMAHTRLATFLEEKF